MTWKGRVYPRGRKLWLQHKTVDGEWERSATPFYVGQETQAEKLLAKIRQKVDAARIVSNGEVMPVTVRGWATKWLENRDSHDETRLRLHVFPIIGDMKISEVRPRHLLEVVDKLKAERAPKTVLNTYGVLQALFRDAKIQELVDSSPCDLRGHLPVKEDRDSGWRAKAVFTREELVTLISSNALIEPDSTVCYAILGLSGLRHGELERLLWKDYDLDAKPLGRLVIRETKTVKERWMPCHPALCRILAAWRERGWALAFGREPGEDDLVMPLPLEMALGLRPTGKRPHLQRGDMRFRDKGFTWQRFTRHLEALGWRHRRVHDLRRTFISLARADGADKDRLRWGTHAAPRDIMSLYTSVDWELVCAEVAKLRVPSPVPPTSPRGEFPGTVLAQSDEKPSDNQVVTGRQDGDADPSKHPLSPTYDRVNSSGYVLVALSERGLARGDCAKLGTEKPLPRVDPSLFAEAGAIVAARARSDRIQVESILRRAADQAGRLLVENT